MSKSWNDKPKLLMSNIFNYNIKTKSISVIIKAQENIPSWREFILKLLAKLLWRILFLRVVTFNMSLRYLSIYSKMYSTKGHTEIIRAWSLREKNNCIHEMLRVAWKNSGAEVDYRYKGGIDPWENGHRSSIPGRKRRLQNNKK